jgi:hypothetical protein
VLAELLQELSSYPVSDELQAPQAATRTDPGGIFVPLKLMTEVGVLSFISTTTIFGTPRDITLSELALEAFFPADPETAAIVRRLSE